MVGRKNLMTSSRISIDIRTNENKIFVLEAHHPVTHSTGGSLLYHRKTKDHFYIVHLASRILEFHHLTG